jgi:Protein of unknown function (DUF5672)
MKLDLSDVTICAVDSVNVGPAARALDRSVAQCRFADAILFSHQPAHGSFRTIKTDRIGSTGAYSDFVFKRLPGMIETPFVLIVQWDGYVIDPNAWSPGFRDYDYIGARWPFVTDGMTVGNGGFSLRSRRFMSAMMESRFPIHEGENSDWLVCRTYRPQLESDFGIRFATESIADRFSYETVAACELTKHRPLTFGFHGMGNMWRYVDDADMIALIDRLSPYVFQTHQCSNLVMTYFLLGRFEVFVTLYARMKAQARSETMLGLIQTVVGEGDAVARCVALGDRLMRYSGSARSFAVKLMQVQRRASLSVARLRGQKSWFEL